MVGFYGSFCSKTNSPQEDHFIFYLNKLSCDACVYVMINKLSCTVCDDAQGDAADYFGVLCCNDFWKDHHLAFLTIWHRQIVSRMAAVKGLHTKLVGSL